MPEKPPTDAAIIKGFEKFEQGFNVWMDEYRSSPEDLIHDMDHDRMWDAHTAYRKRALAAHARIEARKGDQDAQ